MFLKINEVVIKVFLQTSGKSQGPTVNPLHQISLMPRQNFHVAIICQLLSAIYILRLNSAMTDVTMTERQKSPQSPAALVDSINGGAMDVSTPGGVSISDSTSHRLYVFKQIQAVLS